MVGGNVSHDDMKFRLLIMQRFRLTYTFFSDAG